MHWLQALDAGLFRLINLKLANPVFDAVMPFASGTGTSRAIAFTLAAAAGILLVWKGGARGVLCVLMLVLAVSLTDGFVCNTIKHAVGRERPFLVLPDARCLIGKGGSGSMPSSHAANWFTALIVMLVYYRRSVWCMLPVAAVVSYSRVYNGVHYPSDVLAGAILGAGVAAATLTLLNTLWGWAGKRWFPLWWEAVPSLLAPPGRRAAEEDGEGELPGPMPARRGMAPAGFRAPQVTVDAHWLRLGYICIVVSLLARWAYIASGTIQLTEDEAYQWLWSKHLALSYYSKPPLIAYVQFLGTSLWGDNAFGVRFFSPLITAVMGLVLLRFFAREVNARAGFFLLLIATATPLLALGAVLMTVDPLSVLFWTAAMVAGWRAGQERATTRDWLWVGLWMGLGFLSKYTELLQLLCWAVFFALWAPARKQLRRPGPYWALLVMLVCVLPVLIWNYQHGWVTVGHVADDAAPKGTWKPTLRYFWDFLGMEFGLLNPIFFVGTVWAAIALWRRGRHNPLLVYFFSMGAPLFLVYLAHSFQSRNLPNWIAPSVPPLFCMMAVYWDTRWRLGQTKVKGWLTAWLVLGFAAVLAAHDTDVWRVTQPARRVIAEFLPADKPELIDKLTARYLPVNWDPLHRVRVWSEVARVVGEARSELKAEGKPAFIITDHYGLAGLISFYLPEARAKVSDTPLVYFRSTDRAGNQFYYWPGYSGRKGENAIYVRELDRDHPNEAPPPARLQGEFESITPLGVRDVMYHGHVCRPLQLFACRGLK
jgi:membrane-associated phospholipid phosphatase